MQNSFEPHSRLKVRSHESDRDSTSSTAHGFDQNSPAKRRRKSKRNSKHTAYTGEPHALTSLLRGFAIIALLTLGFYQVAKIPFVIPYEKFTGLFEPNTTSVSAKVDQSDNPSTDKVASIELPASVAKTETTNANPTENVTSDPEPVDPQPVDPEPADLQVADTQPTDLQPEVLTSTSESESPEPRITETVVETSTSEIEEIRITKIDNNQSVSGDAATPEIVDTAETPAAATSSTNPQQVTETTATTATTATNTVEASSADVQYTVKAYRATMFSDLSSADATETKVDRGAVVKVLERSGDWVKIEIEDGGKTGYMHITHLSSN